MHTRMHTRMHTHSQKGLSWDRFWFKLYIFWCPCFRASNLGRRSHQHVVPRSPAPNSTSPAGRKTARLSDVEEGVEKKETASATSRLGFIHTPIHSTGRGTIVELTNLRLVSLMSGVHCWTFVAYRAIVQLHYSIKNVNIVANGKIVIWPPLTIFHCRTTVVNV